MMPPENDRISKDAKWMIRMVVAAVAAGIGAAVVVVAVAMPLSSRLATEVRHHEERVRAFNNDVLLELRLLFDGMRDDYRERMHGVEDIERELRAIRQRLESRERSDDRLDRDLARALLNVKRLVDALSSPHPRFWNSRYVAELLAEVRDELRKIQAHRVESGASTTDETQGQEGGDNSAATQDQTEATASPGDTQTQDSGDSGGR